MKSTFLHAILLTPALMAAPALAKDEPYIDPSPTFGSIIDIASGKAVHSMELFRAAWTILAQQRGWNDIFTHERAAIFSTEWQSNAAFRLEAYRKMQEDQRDLARNKPAR